MHRVIVVGGGLAGMRSVEALRSRGYEGALTLVGAEPRRPYDRPPLSKAVLVGDTDDTTIEADWERLGCELLLGRPAQSLRLSESGPGGVVELADGELPFDGLVIATGATPIRLPGPGEQHVIRTLDNALELRARLRAGAHIVVVGAGWIGAEVTTAAAKKGCRVTVIEAADAPLAGAIGPEIGRLTMPWYAEAGAELRCGVKVASVEEGGLLLAGGGDDREPGGGFLAADAVVVGVGVRPEIGWLAGSGLEISRGVVVDESLRTCRPEIVAVGDCAAWWSRRYGRRLLVEHWDTALNAPEVAAAALLEQEAGPSGGATTAVYDAVPYFWSEQFGRMVQYAGHHPAAERMIFRGSPTADDWAAVWLTGDRLKAVLTVNRPRDLVQARRIIAAGTPVDVDLIADPAVAVRNAVRG